MPPMSRRIDVLLDRLGATGSLLCAIHCALLPLLIAVLPSIGMAAWLGDGFETGFVLFATCFGLSVLAWSYRRHRTMHALALLLPGLAVLWVGILYAPLHHSLLPHALAMTAGGTLVGLAHVSNLRLNHRHVHGPACAHRAC
ncbi:MAG TPA: MerC domain-containing protein [Thermomonas sp.]|uniref:MerC domain-containing protein n=1 Tax=Thermomonas sp. TaxID=1971895 RepID=UPI002CB936EA|nr:MerC domain-containing protein [Thermomonas sp.]HOV95841.1 MerC domain-containing protein [Thermomonas sp.]